MSNDEPQPFGPARQITRESVMREVEFLRTQGRAMIERGRVPPPIIAVACEVHPITGVPNDAASCMVPVMHPSHDMITPFTREDMEVCARAVALVGKAFATITIARVETVLKDDVTPEDIAKFHTSGNAVRNHPKRRDALATMVEWRDGTCTCFVEVFVRDQGFTDWYDESPKNGDIKIGSNDLQGYRMLLTPPDLVPPQEVVDASRAVALFVMEDNEERFAVAARGLANTRGGANA